MSRWVPRGAVGETYDDGARAADDSGHREAGGHMASVAPWHIERCWDKESHSLLTMAETAGVLGSDEKALITMLAVSVMVVVVVVVVGESGTRINAMNHEMIHAAFIVSRARISKSTARKRRATHESQSTAKFDSSQAKSWELGAS